MGGGLKNVLGGERVSPKTGGTEDDIPATHTPLTYCAVFDMPCMSDFPPVGGRLVLKCMITVNSLVF